MSSSIPNCFHGGTPRGNMTSFNGISAYFNFPNSGYTKVAVVIFTDATGHDYLYNKRLADSFAEAGYFAVMPDLFAGDALPMDRTSDFDLLGWYRNHLPNKVEPIAKKVIRHLQAQGATTICGAGYSIGAKYVARFLGSRDLVAGFIAHPVFLDTDDVLGISGPISVAFGTADVACNGKKQEEIRSLLKTTKVQHQVNEFSGAIHGFAIVTEPKNRCTMFMKEQSFLQAVNWFNFHTRKGMKPDDWL